MSRSPELWSQVEKKKNRVMATKKRICPFFDGRLFVLYGVLSKCRGRASSVTVSCENNFSRCSSK